MEICCPNCHGSLADADEHVRCEACGNEYKVTAGIPDLRVTAPSWIDFEQDRSRALIIEELVAAKGLEAAIYDVFRNSRKFTHKKSAYRVKQVYAAVEKCTHQIDGWLLPTMEQKPALELGCGPGQLLAAAASRGKDLAGIDVSLEWLVVAKHLVKAHGGAPQLAAGLAERLPIKTGSLSALISLDVIEHVGDQQTYADEIARVLEPGGRFAISTPNRFSLSPEPHVGVWGVGYLPVRLQAQWVKFTSGQSYEFTRLLSVSEVKQVFANTGTLEANVLFPPISDEEIAIFTPTRAKLARLYNRIIGKQVFQSMAPYFGAYYRVTGAARHPG